MNTRRLPDAPARPSILLTLAHLLERLDRSATAVDPTQYQSVVSHLAKELQATPPGPALHAVLSTLPAVAELYENLHYHHAGLCRSPLPSALDAEIQAVSLLRRAAGKPGDVFSG